MSLFNKIKDILFEEEEQTEAIKMVKEEPVKKEPVERKVENSIQSNNDFNGNNFTKEEVEFPKEKDLFTDNSFRFPDFDEEEFKSSIPKRQTTSNVLDYERKKVSEKRDRDYIRYDRNETKELVEKKKFKPSPIISPVYGVLNQDYRPEDVKNRGEETPILNVDEVRKKAFEPEVLITESKSEVIDEPVVTFFEEKEEKTSNFEDMKSIDELLESASDEEITLEDELKISSGNNLDAINEELNNYKEVEEEIKTDKESDDTLENDLFELIDSMYETREDGE